MNLFQLDHTPEITLRIRKVEGVYDRLERAIFCSLALKQCLVRDGEALEVAEKLLDRLERAGVLQSQEKEPVIIPVTDTMEAAMVAAEE